MEPITSEHEQTQGGLTLRDAVALLRRRRWIVITCLLLVPLSAVGFSLLQRAQFQGNAEVLLSQQSLANSLTGVPDPANSAANGDRVAQTQARLATVPTIAARTLEALSLNDRSPADLVAKTEVTTEQNSDILSFKVTDPSRKLAAALANEYAKQYTRYRAEIDTAAVNNALDEVSTRIKGLEAAGERTSSLHSTLVDKQQQLRTLEALQTSNAAVVRLENAAAHIKSATGNDVLAIPADVTRAEDIQAVVDGAVKRFGGVDILVNNAGTSAANPFLDIDDRAWQFDIDLKLMAAVRLCRLVVPQMKQRGGGRIVNVTNLGGKAPNAKGLPTSVTRAAGINLTKSLSKEYAPDKILVNTICIGLIKSAQWERRVKGGDLDAYYRDVSARVPLGRVGEAAEFGDLVAFLVSERAGFITGTAINLDGGASAVV